MFLRFLLCFLVAVTLGRAQSSLVADSLRKSYNEEFDQEKKAELYDLLVTEILETNFGLALTCADTLEALSIRYPRGKAGAARLRAEYQSRTGNSREAVAFLHRELELRNQIADTTGTARTLYELGMNFRELNIPDSALYYFNQSMEVNEQNGDFKQVATVLSAIGQWYSQMNQHTKAIGFFDRAWQTCQSHGDKRGSAYACNNLSVVFGAAGQLDSALIYAQKGIDLALEQEDYYVAGVIAGGICQAYTEAGRYHEAIPFGNRSLAHLTRSGRKQKMVFTYLNLAIAYNRLGLPEEALNFSLPGYQLLEELKLVSPLKHYYEQIAISYERLGRSRDSLHWYKKFILISDSLSEAEQIKQLTAVEARYQLQKAETERVIMQFQEALESLERYRFRSGIVATFSAFLVFGLLGMLYQSRYQKGKKPEQPED